MADLDAALEATWGGRSPESLAHSTLAAVIAGQGDRRRQFASAREQEALKQMPRGTEVIKMGGGMPDHDFLGIAMPQLLSAAETAWEKQQPDMLEYNFGSGVDLLQQQVADYLAESRAQEWTTADDVFITTGNMGGTQLVCQAYLGPGDVGIVESPLFGPSGRIVASTGCDVEAVTADGEGIDVVELERTIEAVEARGQRVRLLYCQPIWHNPTGVCISKARAVALLKVCAKHNVVILADEAYEAYGFEGPPPVYLSALSKGRGVISVMSFSKTIGTGLRLGYIHANATMLEPCSTLSVDQPSVVLQFAVAELLASGEWAKHLERQRREYKARLGALCDGIEEHCQGLATCSKPTGGFFLWVELLGDLTPEEVYIASVRHGLTFSQGPNFFWQTDEKGATDKHLRLAFTSSTQAQLSEAMRRFGEACREAAEAVAAAPAEKASL